ncbi:hypothetical protein Vretifemale_18024 [Volvox reticuliferus]|uniref:non-specific serine/threonine protein kinase n=1 Tax=Volvox reticuliferus TaxID=1737510 RepID=A0A8J4CWJ0_9CHLO|nr:hypothetical protein Vretifemale_18024 [Volvox reticuliferus]
MFPWCFTISAFASDIGNALKRVQGLTFGEEIGQGSICRVYQATCPVSHERFAVKTIPLPKPVCQRAEVLQRAAREAAAARVLSDLVPHPDEIVRHFACVYDEGEDAIKMVMELCRGPCLSKLRSQANSGRIPESRVRKMVAAISRALGHLHDIGLLYVDLKAENVVLDPTEQDPDRVRLVDFDLCRDIPGRHVSSYDEAATAATVIASVDPTASLTISTTKVLVPNGGDDYDNSHINNDNERLWGTAEYLAFEVLQDGAAAYSTASDWWSLGILLYELLYGKAPWSGPSVDVIFHRMMNHRLMFPGPSQGGPQVSTAMQQVIRALLRYLPEMRLGSRGGAREVLAQAALSLQESSGT